MTIAISVQVGEGLVYAADSTSTIFEAINGVSTLAQSFHHAQKLMQIGDYPVGVLTFGLGLIGTRNVESLLAEFESQVLPGSIAPGQHRVHAIADHLRQFLGDRYDHAYPPPAPSLPEVAPPEDTRPALGLVVGGYSYGSFTPEEFVSLLPARSLDQTRGRESAPDLGVRWWGQTEPLQRLLLGFDGGLLRWLVETGVDAAAIHGIGGQLRDRLGWQIRFDAMPLQDAVDLAVYLTNVVIGHSRFVTGPAVCGGHVDVATISHRGYNWTRRKEVRVKSDSTFF